MLTKAEALDFLHNRLGMDTRHLPDPLSLTSLNIIIEAFHLRIPFQNLRLLSKQEIPHVPELLEIKQEVMEGYGGLCYANNVFMKHLLEALGLQTHHIASCCNPSHPNNHIATLVTNLTRVNSKHFVDVGCGYPTYQAIPLDFQIESPIYKSGFLSFKFVKEGDIFQRLHKDISSEFETWHKFYDFDIEHRKLSFFHAPMSEIYCNRFLQKYRLLNFTEDSLRAIKENGSGMQYTELTETCVRKEVVSTREEMVAQSLVLAPMFSKDMVATAVGYWCSTWHKSFSGKS